MEKKKRGEEKEDCSKGRRKIKRRKRNKRMQGHKGKEEWGDRKKIVENKCDASGGKKFGSENKPMPEIVCGCKGALMQTPFRTMGRSGAVMQKTFRKAYSISPKKWMLQTE